MKKMHAERETLHFAAFFFFFFFLQNQLLNVSLKRKTDNVSIIIWRITTEKRARAVGILRLGVDVR